jgi:23S rRNA (guanosine2251-2'-O)-methyltransferase
VRREGDGPDVGARQGLVSVGVGGRTASAPGGRRRSHPGRAAGVWEPRDVTRAEGEGGRRRRRRRPPARRSPPPRGSGERSGRGASFELLVGRRPVEEALRARRRRLGRLWTRRGARGRELDSLVRAAEAAGAAIVEVDAETLREMVGEDAHAQGVALEAGPLPEHDLDGVLGAERTPRRLVALDGVEDPRNVGAIIRVAEAAGAAALVLTERRAPPLSPAVARASAGAVEWLPVARVVNLPRSLAILRSRGFWVLGADAGGGADLFGLPDRVFEGDLVLVLGAEGRGLRPGVRAQVDHLVRIPQAGKVSSLNVASAAAVMLFEIGRRAGWPQPG